MASYKARTVFIPDVSILLTLMKSCIGSSGSGLIRSTNNAAASKVSLFFGASSTEGSMSYKRPLCNYSGVMKELASGDSLPGNTIVSREAPSGLINGVNCIFTLAYAPITDSEMVFLNGVLQNAGAGNSYTISGQAITFNSAPTAGQVILVTYWR